MIRVVVEDRDPRVADTLVEALARTGEINADPVTGWDALRRAVAGRPGTVVVLGPGSDEGDFREVIRLARDLPGTGFVHVADVVDARTLQSAMRHGIDDVVAVEDTEDELVPAVERAYERAARLVAPTSPSGPAKQGRVITVFGPKGGTGKTMVATNLAVLLAEAGVKTVLLDAGVRFGDCAAFLRLRPERTLYDLAGISGGFDDSVLRGVLTPHESGLDVVAAPGDVLDAEKLDGDLVGRAIRGLARRFDAVIVDTSPALDDFTLVALAEADLAFLVTSLELPAVKDAKLCLTTLERLQLGLEKVHIILNRANSKVGFPPEEVGRALGSEIVAELPSDVAVPRSVNSGVPVHVESRKSKIARDLAGLAGDLRDELLSETPSKGRSLLARGMRTRAAEL